MQFEIARVEPDSTDAIVLHRVAIFICPIWNPIHHGIAPTINEALGIACSFLSCAPDELLYYSCDNCELA